MIAAIITALTAILIVVVPKWGDAASQTYSVTVRSMAGQSGVIDAKVILQLSGGPAALEARTDSNGQARMLIPSVAIGKPGRLQVEADGYEPYRQELDVNAGSLPVQILLAKRLSSDSR
ncbi:MAG TPA: carboxypeptidase-like regulatory domain-containing protein [Pyrinomonadaceae bacterium]